MNDSSLAPKAQLPDPSCKGFCRMVFRDKRLKGHDLDVDDLHDIVHANETSYVDMCPGLETLKDWIEQFEMEIS